jgi:hypothetical protein
MTTSEYFQSQICNGRPTYDFVNEPENALFNLLVTPWLEKNATTTFKELREAQLKKNAAVIQ